MTALTAALVVLTGVGAGAATAASHATPTPGRASGASSIVVTTRPLTKRIGVSMSVRVPGKGTVRVRDLEVGKAGKQAHKKAWFNAITRTATRAGVVHLVVVPNQTGRTHVTATTVTFLAEVTFTPAVHSSPAHKRVTISWHRRMVG